jgi:ribonuclease HI
MAGVTSSAIAHIDGGCRPVNPGHAGFAVVIDLDGEEFILSRYLGWPLSNNVAEFTALIVAVKYARHLGAEALEVVSDSKLVVEQVHGRWRQRSETLRPLVMEARKLLDQHYASRWDLTWSARNENVKADYYCGLAIEAGRNLNPWHTPKKPGKILDPFSSSRVQGSVGA